MSYPAQAPRELWSRWLTDRQAAAVEQVALGKSNIEAAEDLCVTQQTIKYHLTEAFLRIDVDSRLAAARWWWDNVELAEMRDNHRETVAGLRARLAVKHDVDERMVHFEDGATLASWVDVHRLHKDPYVGCVFCRDQFYSRAEVERALAHFGGVSPSVVKDAVDGMAVAVDEYVARTIERIRESS